MAEPGDSVPGLLLALGVAAGVALTAVGLLRPEQAPQAPGAVALVNGQPIAAESFERFVAALEGAGAVDAARRRSLLEEAIDEELLVQAGIELGLARVEPRARRSIVATMALVVTGAAGTDPPDDEALRAFHARHPERFGAADRYRLVAARSPAQPDERAAFRAAAREAEAARAGAALRPLADVLGADAGWARAEGGLPLPVLEARLGKVAAAAVAELEPGASTPPLRTPEGWLVLGLAERFPGPPAAFEEVRDEVRRAYLRNRSDAALASFVSALRDQADVRILDLELADP